MARTPRTPKKEGNARARSSRREPWFDPFLNALRNTGNIFLSAKSAKVGRQTVYDHRARNPKFAAEWDEALADAADLIDAEIFRRGVKGVEKPVFYKGKEIATIREYSDTLLMFYAKGIRPEKYKDLDVKKLSELLAKKLAENGG